jgi:hypothetical protein
MADYYSILAKAVRALDPSTGEARKQLYECGRSAMVSEIERAFPPLHWSEVAAAKESLESAIEKIEAEAVRRNPPRLAVSAADHHAPLTAIPGLAGEQSDEVRGSLKKRWTGMIRRSAGPKNVPGRDTWLTELLERASHRADNDEDDFAPKRARAVSDSAH